MHTHTNAHTRLAPKGVQGIVPSGFVPPPDFQPRAAGPGHFSRSVSTMKRAALSPGLSARSVAD